jgi:hypothetical protein
VLLHMKSSMVISPANMSASGPTSQYALGSTDPEHERLFETLSQKLKTELAASNSETPLPAHAGAAETKTTLSASSIVSRATAERFSRPSTHHTHA